MKHFLYIQSTGQSSNQTQPHLQTGIGMIEIILALGLFLILAGTGITALLQTFTLNQKTEYTSVANLLAQEGLEAARILAYEDWDTLSPGNYGLTLSSGGWEFSGSSEVIDAYTRTVTIDAVERDGSNTIVSSGGTIDPDTLKITTTVSWNLSPLLNNSIVKSSYISNWQQDIIGDWSAPTQAASLDLPGGQNGDTIIVDGNYAYITRSSGSRRVTILDVSNPAAPVEVGTNSMTSRAQDTVLYNDYLYAATSTNSEELVIIDVSDPTNPNQTSTINLAGNQNGRTVSINGTNLYIGRSNSNNELAILSVSNPSTPVSLSSLNINDIFASDTEANLLYAAGRSNGAELQIIDISNPSSPSLTSSLDLSGASNGISIAISGSTIFLGRDNGELVEIDVSTPSSPSVVNTYTAGGQINAISIISSNYLALATDATTEELQIIDTSAGLTQATSIDTNDTLNDVWYDTNSDRLYAVGDDQTEVLVYQPS